MGGEGNNFTVLGVQIHRVQSIRAAAVPYRCAIQHGVVQIETADDGARRDELQRRHGICTIGLIHHVQSPVTGKRDHRTRAAKDSDERHATRCAGTGVGRRSRPANAGTARAPARRGAGHGHGSQCGSASRGRTRFRLRHLAIEISLPDLSIEVRIDRIQLV